MSFLMALADSIFSLFFLPMPIFSLISGNFPAAGNDFRACSEASRRGDKGRSDERKSAPLPCGAAVSLIAQTGHSDDSHSPDERARTVVTQIHPASLSIEVVCTVAISWPPSDLRTMSIICHAAIHRAA
jgi:hypothetical protein